MGRAGEPAWSRMGPDGDRLGFEVLPDVRCNGRSLIFPKLPLAMFLIRMHNTLRCVTDMVGVAQLARATGCGPVGRGFESLYPPHASP